MIDEKKINIGNIILLLKHIGYCKTLKRTSNSNFEHSSLGKRFEEMIVEEYKKKEERDERLLADLCECYLLLNGRVSLELLSICASCILKVALNKEENEKVQKEVEMALLASNCFGYHKIEKKLYLNEMTEIIHYHQEHHNLTRLAYQSAWKFLIDRLLNDRYLEEVFVNELHFVREARSELDELSKCIDWKAKEEGGGRKEKKEMDIILGWLQILEFFFSLCQLWNEEFAELVSSIVQVFRAAKDNYGEINDQCVHLLILTEDKRGVKDLLNGGAVDAFMEEIIQSTLKDGRVWDLLVFFDLISCRLKRKKGDEKEEAKRKLMKMEIFGKMEEEGYEDIITSFSEVIDFFYRKHYHDISLNISDYFVNI